ncbi:MAG: hypothetical protein KatS3mg043_2078 [Rhodothermaceae bacterium]|nr:MAG: hypothetical protein KatS3mg043_2078 [Rhodothermaceae bacterium]
MRLRIVQGVSLLMGLVWVGSSPAAAQAVDGPWQIHSPAPDTLVQDGSLFVVVTLQAGKRLDPASVRLYLDGQELTRQAKVSDTSVRLLYARRLGAGRHTLHIEGQEAGGSSLPALQWSFRVAGAAEDAAVATAPRPARRFDFTGSTILDTRTSDFSGRRDLRQEPLRTYVLQAEAEGRYGAFTFPVRLYLTTDEDPRAQPRNRFLVGVRSEHLTLLLGDNTPLYNPLMLDGARTRGIRAELYLHPVRLAGVHGQLRRGIEPERLPGAISGPAAFTRTLTALRLGVGSERSVLWHLDVARARDDAGSLPEDLAEATGLTPMENLVAGSSLSLRLLQGRLYFEGGGALSLTTEDVARGVATRARIDSLFDTHIPVDPADLAWLFTFNTTTVPLRPDRLSSLAWYLRGRVAAGGHTFTAEVRQVGEAYVAFGNPFLLSDRRSLTLTDRFKLLGDRLSGTLRYQHYGTPRRDDPTRASLNADLFYGQVALAPWRRPTWFFASLRLHNRSTTREGTGDPASDTRVRSFSVGGYHLARSGDYQHGLSLSYTYTDRRDVLLPALDNVTRVITAGLNETFPFPLYFNMQLNHLLVTSGDQGTLRKLTTLSGLIGYRLRRPELDVSAGVQNTHTAETELFLTPGGEPLVLPGSDRIGLLLRGVYRLRRDMELELQLGYDTYRGEAEYTDRYVVLRHRYTF